MSALTSLQFPWRLLLQSACSAAFTRPGTVHGCPRAVPCRVEINSGARLLKTKLSLGCGKSHPFWKGITRSNFAWDYGKEWMCEPKWDGFPCLVFRDEENVLLQSRTG